MKLLIDTYNGEVDKWDKTEPDDRGKVDDFVLYDDKKIKWSYFLKGFLNRNKHAIFNQTKLRNSQYRPFVKRHLFFDRIANECTYLNYKFFPTTASEEENRVICVGGYGRRNFAITVVDKIPDLNFYGDPQQSFPFYTYNEDGTGRRENITNHTLKLFRNHYKDTKPPSSSGTDEALNKPPSSRGEDLTKSNQGGFNDNPPCEAEQITKWDIFYYIYAMLHHKDYRKDYEKNLKRSLPRIPFAPDFWSFSSIGKRLADIHLNYENTDIYELEEVIDKDKFPDVKFTVDKMKITKDKKSLVYNKAITLAGIPPEVYEYKLGNRSALEWIVDQYRVKTDKRSGITQDPNNFDGNERYIFELIGKVVTVSLETVKLVNELSKLPYK